MAGTTSPFPYKYNCENISHQVSSFENVSSSGHPQVDTFDICVSKGLSSCGIFWQLCGNDLVVPGITTYISEGAAECLE